jgi:hypothetical protein
MLVFDSKKSDILRLKFINTFVNTGSDYYIKHVKNRQMFSDGLCYTGYLWDCLLSPKIISESELNQILCEKQNIFIMWDIHTCDQIFIPDYWKFPKSSVLFVENWTDELKVDLPEDIYIFDENFNWAAVYTHEDDFEGNRWCLLVES